MNIPIFTAIQFTDENGSLTSDQELYMSRLNQAMQDGLSENGWTLPVVSVAQLAQIAALTGDREMPNGTMWYVHDAGAGVYEMVVKINNALRKVSTTAYP